MAKQLLNAPTWGQHLRRTLCLSLLATCVPLSAVASEKGESAKSANLLTQQSKSYTLKGLVLDAQTNEAVIGATVLIKGTSRGTTTDIDGKFSLSVSAGEEISISFVGYTTQTIRLGQNKELTIKLKEDAKMLAETVVVGYGVQKKVNLSGSVSSVDSKTLEARPIQNISGGLQGMVPGLTISGTNGAPGMDGGNIRIRGTGTLNNSSPYILIDGIESGSINAIDPNDIASISVLKDAASAAIYGSKAANGVILITTKRGKTGKPRVSYNGYFSAQSATNLVERMPSYEYAELSNKIAIAEGGKALFTADEIEKMRNGSDPDNYPNTDWYALAFKTGIQHRHSVNVSGGSEYVKYMASVGYLNQGGILPGAKRQQFNARTNLDMQLSKRIQALLGLSYIKNDYTDPSSAYAGGGSDQIIRQLNRISPWVAARKSDGTWGTIGDGNPIAWLDNKIEVNRKNTNFTANASLSYQLIDGLKLTATLSHVRTTQHYDYFQKFFEYNPNKKTEPNFLKEQVNSTNLTNFDFLLNYDKSLGEHNLKVLGGYHAEAYDTHLLYGNRQNFPNNSVTDLDAGDASTQKNLGYTGELHLLSWFGRINYDYAGKYLFEVNLRADASSRFSEGYRWGVFPSFSAAWRISKERFMQNITWLNDLKLRASWGMLGNQAALQDFYPSISTYKIGYTYPFGGNLATGYAPEKKRLKAISWEKSTNYGVGLDFALWGNKLTGSVDVYNRKTTGILMDVDAPNEFQLGGYKDNVGSMENKGVELFLAYRTNIGAVDCSVNANVAYNRNTILSLGEVDYIGETERKAVGQPLGAHYLYIADGFFQSQAEADAYTAKYGNPFGTKFQAGDIRYVDVNGDGKLTDKDRTYRNSSEPVWTFGFGFNLGYKNFDLSATFNGVADASRYFGREVYGSFDGDDGHPSTVWRDAWSESNKGGTMPRLYSSNRSASAVDRVPSSFWLQDISYLRMKNLQIGYTLPKAWLASLGVSNVRVYYSVENLFTIDKMRVNADPEATSARLSSYPLLRTHALGLNVTF